MPRVEPPGFQNRWPNSWNFLPSTDWQDCPDDENLILPNGGDYRTDFSTGKRKVRWDPPVPNPEMVLDRRTLPKVRTESASQPNGQAPKNESQPLPKSSFCGQDSTEHFNASLGAVVFLEHQAEAFARAGNHTQAQELSRMAKAARLNHERFLLISGLAKTYEFKGNSPVGYLSRGICQNDILVGNGYLERGSAMLIAGPSGVGKSSVAMQTGCCWSCGATAFEFSSVRPLRIAMMQHEDSGNDLIRMSQVVRYLGLDQNLIHKNFWIETVRGKTGKAAVEIMRALCQWWRAEILILNPLTGYHDGDISQNRDNIRFLYDAVGEVLDELKIGLVAIHHKGKPPKNGHKDTQDVYHEIMYDVLGGSTLINFSAALSPSARSPIP
jgi:hypothetical protein